MYNKPIYIIVGKEQNRLMKGLAVARSVMLTVVVYSYFKEAVSTLKGLNKNNAKKGFKYCDCCGSNGTGETIKEQSEE